jgi:Ankyrin repeats (3 copies)
MQHMHVQRSDVYIYYLHNRYTMLHTAAMNSRADCVPQLVEKGVTAVDARGRSALQLACLYSDAATVQALIDSGGWLDSHGIACMLNATISGQHEFVTALIKRGVDCTAAIDDSGYTLLHAAAAYARQKCLDTLLQHVGDAKALTTDGVSVLDVAFGHELPAVFIRDGVKRPEWCDRLFTYRSVGDNSRIVWSPELSKREATAMILLKLGVDYDANKIVAGDACAVLIKRYLDELRAQAAQQQLLLQQHHDIHTDTTATTAAASAAGGSSTNTFNYY